MSNANHPVNGQRRRRIFADIGVQGRLLRHILLHWIGFLLATAAILVFLEMLSGGSGGLARVREMHMPTLVAVIVLAPVFIRDMIQFSHRFVGPVVRLRREMKDLADGKINPPLKFRENDYWKEMADDFNRLSARMAKAEKEASSAKSASVESVPEHSA